ncbi:MAG: CPBP family intramembrane metalloprotease [Clostridium sp.]|nr:CPBP family intramembrane metalloprotease [Clostridium sp.]
MSQYYYNPFGNSDVNEESQRYFMRKQQEQNEKREIRKISLAMGCAIIAYLIVQEFVVLLLQLFGLTELYLSSPVFQSAFIIIGVSFMSVVVPFGVMALVNKKKYTVPIVPNKPIRLLRCFAWIAFGMISCITANVVVNYIITTLQAIFDIEFTQSQPLSPNSVLACVMTVIGTAIIPAICEEFAMRCCSLQLLRKYGKGFAVFAVSIVFGLLHGNVVQFLFAFIIGLVLGLATVKTDSIVPAICIHACNNGISVVNSIVTYAVDESVARTVVVFIYLFWLVFGIFGLIYLVRKGELKKNTVKKDNGVLTVGQKFVSFLFPWMIVPFLILILFTVSTIK